MFFIPEGALRRDRGASRLLVYETTSADAAPNRPTESTLLLRHIG